MKKPTTRFKITFLFLTLSLLLLPGCQVRPTHPGIQLNTQTEILEINTLPPATPTQKVSLTITKENTKTATSTALPPAGKQVTLMAVGDIMLGRTLADLIQSAGTTAPFSQVSNYLSSADITLGNLECAISTQGEPETKAYTFRAPLEAAESLRMAGFDLVNLANNHVLDYGEVAFFDTLHSLSEQTISYVGAGSNAIKARTPVIIEKNGLKLAFLGYFDIPIGPYDYTQWQAVGEQPGIAWGFHHYISEDVKKARLEADVVIVMMHFGNEYAEVISQAQIDSAYTAIDAGATLVIGSHPHVLQPIEIYNDGLIAYSLGNFVFDQFYEKANQTAILRVDISSDGLMSYDLVPVQIQADGTPMLIP